MSDNSTKLRSVRLHDPIVRSRGLAPDPQLHGLRSESGILHGSILARKFSTAQNPFIEPTSRRQCRDARLSRLWTNPWYSILPGAPVIPYWVLPLCRVARWNESRVLLPVPGSESIPDVAHAAGLGSTPVSPHRPNSTSICFFVTTPSPEGCKIHVSCSIMSFAAEVVELGRHAILRGWWGDPCRFESGLRHHTLNLLDKLPKSG